MTRREFTRKISELLLEMIEAGEEPVLDYVLRSTTGQKEMFDRGVSGCDGTVKKSSHQSAKAADIYLVEYNSSGKPYVQYDWDTAKARLWHDRWVRMGGRGMIVFKNKDGKQLEDRPHFQG